MTPDDHRPTARTGPQAARLGGRMRSAVTLCTRGWRWAAVAVAAIVLVLAAGLMTAGPARATPPAGVTTEILGSGTTLGGFKIHVDGIKVESKNAASVTVAHLTFAPGGTTGWHVHPGPVLVTVISGSVTKFSADCTAQTYTAGQAFVENGPTDENMVRNDGSVQAETIVTFLTPPGAPIREDAPPPPGCNP
jgi:quercetin dioxygenase-like cupin family protein